MPGVNTSAHKFANMVLSLVLPQYLEVNGESLPAAQRRATMLIYEYRINLRVLRLATPNSRNRSLPDMRQVAFF
jgi:hypothetical protein